MSPRDWTGHEHRETGRVVLVSPRDWLSSPASFSVEGWCGHGLGASAGGRRSRHRLESAGEGMGLGAQRESYTIRAVQMPKVQDRVRVWSQVDF